VAQVPAARCDWVTLVKEPLPTSELERLCHSVARWTLVGSESWTAKDRKGTGLEIHIASSRPPKGVINSLCPLFSHFWPLYTYTHMRTVSKHAPHLRRFTQESFMKFKQKYVGDLVLEDLGQ
jgi:hypothetical protein